MAACVRFLLIGLSICLCHLLLFPLFGRKYRCLNLGGVWNNYCVLLEEASTARSSVFLLRPLFAYGSSTSWWGKFTSWRGAFGSGCGRYTSQFGSEPGSSSHLVMFYLTIVTAFEMLVHDTCFSFSSIF